MLLSLGILAIFLLLLMVGVPIAFSLISVGLAGLFIMDGTRTLGTIARMTFNVPSNFILLAVPLFIFIGELLARSEISADLFNLVDRWIGRIPGSLALTSTVTGGILSACVGSSGAVASTVSAVALPQMIKRGYNKGVACGAVAGGSLGMVIPPSLGFVIYGVMTETSVGKLFLAGVIPGLLMLLLVAVYVIGASALHPAWAPHSPRSTWKEKLDAFVPIWPIPLLMFGVLGTIYLGVATPTEAAALGGVIALLFSALKRKLTWKTLQNSVFATIYVNCWIFFVMIGASVFTHLLVRQGFISSLGNIILELELPVWTFLLLMELIYVVMGMFMEGMSILLLTVPIFYPIITAMHMDPIWFGVVVITSIELGLLTPPVGLVSYIIKDYGTAHGVTMAEVFRGIIPTSAAFLIAILLVMFFPQLATWLPSLID